MKNTKIQQVAISMAIAGLVWLFWFVVFKQNTIGIDDANIFKVYAQNFSNGFGFVYQQGGPRVEGFTSLLFVLLLSLLYTVTGNIDASGMVLSLSFFLLVVGVATTLVISIYQGSQKVIRKQISVSLFIAWLFVSPYFVIWLGLTQMDTGLWTLMVLLALGWSLQINLKKRLASQLIIGGALVCLLTLTRPEGMLLSALLPLSWLLKVFVDVNRQKQYVIQQVFQQSLVAICLLGVWASAIIGLTWFRLQYFDWPLPNTYYAKVSPDLWYRIGQGLLYAWSFLIHQPVMFVIFGLGIYLVFSSLRSLSKQRVFEQLLFGVFLLSLFLVPIVNGGDHFAGWRMYQPLWPVAGLIGMYFFLNYPPKWFQTLLHRCVPMIIVAGLFIVISASQPYLLGKDRMSLRNFLYEFRIAEEGRAIGTQLNRWFDSQNKPVVGVITAGGIAMTYQGEVYDMLGLNELSIAHDGGKRKGIKNHASLNPELVVSKSPELLLPKEITYGMLLQTSTISQVLLQNTLFAQTLFTYQPLKEKYAFVWLTQEKLTVIGIHPTASGVAVFVRKDYLDELRTTEKFQIQEISFN